MKRVRPRLFASAHLEAMINVAERAYSERISEEQKWSNALSIENENLRAALEFAKTFDAERYLMPVRRTRLVLGSEITFGRGPRAPDRCARFS